MPRHFARPHIGRVPMKFYFRAQDINIQLPGHDTSGKLVVVWKRGPRRTETAPIEVKEKLSSVDGSLRRTAATLQDLAIICTMFKNAKTGAFESKPELTRTPRGLCWVRTGYAYQPPALGTYRRHRAACPKGPAYCTYWVRVPASGVGYVPRTVAPQAYAHVRVGARGGAASSVRALAPATDEGADEGAGGGADGARRHQQPGRP